MNPDEDPLWAELMAEARRRADLEWLSPEHDAWRDKPQGLPVRMALLTRKLQEVVGEFRARLEESGHEG